MRIMPWCQVVIFNVCSRQGVFSKETNLNKAREHSLLVSNRPPFVTILTLVRDAAARLPNGEGTRAEVSTSAFYSPSTAVITAQTINNSDFKHRNP
jgi:hypothetical protein